MRRSALVLLLAVPALALGAQTVTKVGICDWMKVLNSSFKETKAYRDYFDARDQVLKEIASTEQKILDLEAKKLDADRAGDQSQSLQLDKQITDQRNYLEDYRRIKGAQLAAQANRIMSSSDFMKQMMGVVKIVAESEGLALVIRSDGAYADLILYNIPEIDVTEKVIAEIFRQAGKSYPGSSP